MSGSLKAGAEANTGCRISVVPKYQVTVGFTEEGTSGLIQHRRTRFSSFCWTASLESSLSLRSSPAFSGRLPCLRAFLRFDRIRGSLAPFRRRVTSFSPFRPRGGEGVVGFGYGFAGAEGCSREGGLHALCPILGPSSEGARRRPTCRRRSADLQAL